MPYDTTSIQLNSSDIMCMQFTIYCHCVAIYLNRSCVIRYLIYVHLQCVLYFNNLLKFNVYKTLNIYKTKHFVFKNY